MNKSRSWQDLTSSELRSMWLICCFFFLNLLHGAEIPASDIWMLLTLKATFFFFFSEREMFYLTVLGVLYVNNCAAVVEYNRCWRCFGSDIAVRKVTLMFSWNYTCNISWNSCFVWVHVSPVIHRSRVTEKKGGQAALKLHRKNENTVPLFFLRCVNFSDRHFFYSAASLVFYKTKIIATALDY